MQITAQMVSALREQTGAGMMECKKALTEAEGDMERARDILRLKGQTKAAQRAGRTAGEGVVAAAHEGDVYTLVELNSETDFVARNEDFRQLAHEIAAVAARTPHAGAEELMDAPMGDGKTVRDKIDDALARLREHMVLRRSVRFEGQPDSVIAQYVHVVDHKTGVMVELEGDPSNEAQMAVARGIAMHAAFTKPKYLDRSQVPAEAVEHERQVLTELTRNEGKPDAAIPKIVEGRLGKFYETVCLVDQPYVRDQSKKVAQLAAEAGAKVRRFALIVVGQE